MRLVAEVRFEQSCWKECKLVDFPCDPVGFVRSNKAISPVQLAGLLIGRGRRLTPKMAALLGCQATRPESCVSTRYNSHRDYPEWRLVTNLLERGVARPLAAVRFPVVTKAPSDTLISAREEHEASSGRKGERGAALEYPRGGLPVLPL